MELIDLSRELFHRPPRHIHRIRRLSSRVGSHSEKKVAGNTVFTSKAL